MSWNERTTQGDSSVVIIFGGIDMGIAQLAWAGCPVTARPTTEGTVAPYSGSENTVAPGVWTEKVTA